MNLRFVVAGTIRDGEKQISKQVNLIYSALKPLGEVQFLVVESDSQDSTPLALKSLQTSLPGFDYVSLGNLSERIPNRIERLIFCRNTYMEEIKSTGKYSRGDFFIVADLDGVNSKLRSESVKVSLKRREEWAAIFANQTYKYYDLLALRHNHWCPQNVFDEYAWLRNHIPPKSAKKLAIFDRMIHIKSSLPLIEVKSAFGGFGIYKPEFFLSSSYTRTAADFESDIDHVIFNRRIVEMGGKLYIDPQLINASWTMHSLSSNSFFRAAATLKRSFSF